MIEDNTYIHVAIALLVVFLRWEIANYLQILPVPWQNAPEFSFSYNVYPVVAYPAFNIGHFEYEVLLLKVIFLGS